MPAIPPNVKVFVIERLASFELPSEVVSAVKAEYGLSISRSMVECYHPGKVSGKRLSKRVVSRTWWKFEGGVIS
jgi:hypothetical protein